MTELKEELKVTPDEEPVEYVERAEAALDQHYRETGERLSVWSTIPGEGPGEVLERLKVVKEVDAIRGAGRAREARRQERAEEAHRKDATGGESTHHRNYRAKSQERDIERAVSEFEVAKQRLYRSDGTKVYGEGEHAERLENLTEGLREKGEAVAREAHEDAEGYDKEALALSYVDPVQMVPSSERGRLEATRAFVKEDCEAMSILTLAERVSAVSAGSDRVAKVLHARYARRRLGALDAEALGLAAEERPPGAEAAAERRRLAEVVSAWRS